MLAAALLLCLTGCRKGEVTGGSVDDRTDSSAPAPEPAAVPGPTAAPKTGDGGDAPALLGEWSEDCIYTNEVFGPRYTLPDNRVYANREEILAMSQLTIESSVRMLSICVASMDGLPTEEAAGGINAFSAL